MAFAESFEIGKSYIRILTDDNSKQHEVGFQVLKECTKQEYMDSILEELGPEKLKIAMKWIFPRDKFYLVSID